MARNFTISLALALALATIPMLASSALAAQLNRSTAVFGNDGKLIGQDPDLSILSYMVRDPLPGQ